MKWLLLPDLDLALGLHFWQSFVLKTNVGDRDRAIGSLIFIDFRN